MSRYLQRRDPKTGRTYYCHRAVAEWHLGRPLEPGEMVHHRDENRQDDHPDNLLVLRRASGLTCSCTGTCGERHKESSTCSTSRRGSSCTAKPEPVK